MDAIEISSSEPVRLRGFFDGFSIPFQFESQKREQSDLEKEQLDRLNSSVIDEEDEALGENQNDGLGQQLSSAYIENS